MSTQAELLSLNRSGLYYQPVPPSAEEVVCKHRIDEIYTAHPYYGYRRIAAQLHRDGQPINQKTVACYMQEMGLAAMYPGPNLDTIPIGDTVGELVGAELGSLLGSKSSKVRNSCFLHFFSCYEGIETKKIDSSSNEGMLQ